MRVKAEMFYMSNVAKEKGEKGKLKLHLLFYFQHFIWRQLFLKLFLVLNAIFILLETRKEHFIIVSLSEYPPAHCENEWETLLKSC